MCADIRSTILGLRAQQEEMQKIHDENVRATIKKVLACSFAHTMRCWPGSTRIKLAPLCSCFATGLMMGARSLQMKGFLADKQNHFNEEVPLAPAVETMCACGARRHLLNRCSSWRQSISRRWSI
jgi:hypothetical protein